MSNIKKILTVVLSLPKTVYFNFRSFPLKTAIKLPCLVHYRTKIVETHKGIIKLPETIGMFMIKFGFGGTISTISNRINVICLERGEVAFAGKAQFAEGFSISSHGICSIGDNFYANKNMRLSCALSVSIGDDVLLGWNIVIRDSDGHVVIHDGIEKERRLPVRIDNHTWVCSETHILKGTVIPEGSIVGYRSLVTKAFEINNSLIAGSPAKILQENIEWDY